MTTHGACGKSWTQRGERTSHCGGCHETFGALSIFDKHRRDGRCLPPAEGLVQDGEGVWCTTEGLANREALGIRLRAGQERVNAANVGTGEGKGLEGAQIGAREVYARGGPLGGSTTVAVSHVGYCARGHDLYAIDGVTQHIITHAETKSGNWAKATCPNVIAGEK